VPASRRLLETSWEAGLGLRSGERYKLSQWGPGRNPVRKRILVYFELESQTWLQHFLLFILAWNGAVWNIKQLY